MNTLQTLYKLKDAYGASTRNNNIFKAAVEAIRWDDTFEADGEKYFLLGDMTFTVQSLNPFSERWKPAAMFSDGTCVEF